MKILQRAVVTALAAGASLAVQAQDININSATFHAQKGTALGVDQIGGGIKNLMKYQKELVFNILDRMGHGDVSPAVRKEINQMATNNVDALLAYSVGLDHKDHGRYDQAKESFAAAAALDPGFALAHHAHESMPDIQDKGQIQQVSMQQGKGNAQDAESKDDGDLTTKQDAPVEEGQGSTDATATTSMLDNWLDEILALIPTDIVQDHISDSQESTTESSQTASNANLSVDTSYS